MKRLVGGDYQLDLSPIEIEESADGETYTSITDKSVLDQLTGLKDFIGKSGMIKPIWIKLLNGETDEIVVTRGSLSTSDGTTFLIKILLVGFILTLSVEFTQTLNEDDEPLDDWYIDTNDAKYILISDTQAIANIEELPVFENIVDKDGHKRFIEGDIDLWADVPEGITKTYGKWSLSGSHLMIVLALDCADATQLNNGQPIATMTLPEWVQGKLVPIYLTNLDFKAFSAYASDYSTQSISVYCEKATNAIQLRKGGSTTFNADRSVRIAFDFIIDNETPAP